MILYTLTEQSFAAIGGGFAAEVLHWYMLSRRPGALPQYSTSVLFWVTTLLMIGVGGIMPLLYIEGPASAVLCFHLGAGTPLILQKLVSALPNLAPTQSRRNGTLKDFFAW